MNEVYSQPLNASSIHACGRKARQLIEESRKIIAEVLNVFPREIYFTASATEANHWALRGFPGRRVICSAIEHNSVRVHAQAVFPVDENGVADLHALDEALAANPSPAIVSLMLANNETGVMQPVREAAEICRRHGALLHSDAVQAVGKIPLDFTMLGADLYTVSAHKCGGPVGAAALISRGAALPEPVFRGGGQEMSRRAGTENIAAIAGFARALETVDFGHYDLISGWRTEMEAEMLANAPHAVIFGARAPRLPTATCIALPGISSEIQLMKLDLAGFAVSAGAACTSGKIEPSHVLLAMGAPAALAACAIRISAGWNTKAEELQAFTRAWSALSASRQEG